MPQRLMGPGGPVFLEWGELSDEPRSSVHDADGAFLFTGSYVRLARGGQRNRVGEVWELLARDRVRVVWTDDLSHSDVDSRTVRVRVARPGLASPGRPLPGVAS